MQVQTPSMAEELFLTFQLAETPEAVVWAYRAIVDYAFGGVNPTEQAWADWLNLQRTLVARPLAAGDVYGE